MSATEKTVSALIDRQLPEFVRADHPKFKQFVNYYYKWLETDGSTANYNYGNTVFHIMNAEKYRDIDNTLDPFIRLFKEELLPYFPEKTELDLVKVLKGAREFYQKKGTEESLKWLFKALFGEDIEIFYPKKQILIASDGKWKLPRAFNLTASAENLNINPNLLERRKATGVDSKATCFIESANRTIDKNFGTEIFEVYVSNVVGTFNNGEQLQITYTDEYDVVHVFTEKIIGSISNIKIDPQHRGITYNVGDPVVVFGGLDNTIEARDAIAIVGNVTYGSIESVGSVFPGFGYTLYPGTEVIALRSPEDDPNANASVDIKVTALNLHDSTSNSQDKFLETITIDTMPIEWLSTVQVGNSTAQTAYTVFTQNNRNILINVTENNSSVKYRNYEDFWADGPNYALANVKGKIFTLNTSVNFGLGGTVQTGNVILYAVTNSASFPISSLAGKQIYGNTSGKVFNVNSPVLNQQITANADSQLIQCLNYQDLQTGGIQYYTVYNGGYGFRITPSLDIQSYFDTAWSALYINQPTQHALYRQKIGSYGKIAHVWIVNGGTGYSTGDQIIIKDDSNGYGFVGNVTVNATGTIISTNIIKRGEGYNSTNRTVTINTSGGSGATLTAYGFGEGAGTTVRTGKIGRIKDLRVISRGYDYIAAPIVSLKIVDMIITAIPIGNDIVSGQRVFQGASLSSATFQGIVKSYNRSTGLLRLFNYSGSSGAAFNPTLPFTSETGVTFSVDTTKKVPTPDPVPALGAFGDPYSSVRDAGGLPNPWFYGARDPEGGGFARAYAEFYNGLINFPGFYLNTDGFLSADKKTQDDKTYHNFSYVIESGLSLADYKASLSDIAHPTGTSMLAKTITDGQEYDQMLSNSVVTFSPYVPVTTSLTANSFWSNANVVISGTTDTTVANVGDLIVINNKYTKQINGIVAGANSIIVKLESNTSFIGDGKLKISQSSNTLVVTNNSVAMDTTVFVNDRIRFNLASTIITSNVISVTGNTIIIDTPTSQITSSANNKVYKVYPTISAVSYKFIKN